MNTCIHARNYHKIDPIAVFEYDMFRYEIDLLSAEIYVYGTQYWMIGFSYPFVVAATAHIYLPVYFKLQAKSVHYYLELRFNRAVRIFASVCFILLTCIYLAIVVYAPALALAQGIIH